MPIDLVKTSHPLETLDWGFAGTSRRWHDEAGVLHGEWVHWVDSLSSNANDANSVQDTGIITESTNDRATGLCSERETGAMLNRAVGEIQEHEEAWFDVFADARIDCERSDGMCELVNSDNKAPRTRVCVLKGVDPISLHYPDNSGFVIKCYVIRVGNWCQGILRHSDGPTHARRWFAKGTGTKWDCVASVGLGNELDFMMGIACGDIKLRRGEVFTYSGVHLEVMETV